MSPNGLNEGYQLLLVAISATLAAAVTFSLCRRYYQARMAAISVEVSRLRQSLSVAQDLLSQSHRTGTRLRSMAANDDQTRRTASGGSTRSSRRREKADAERSAFGA